jgi:hypothetical protein
MMHKIMQVSAVVVLMLMIVSVAGAQDANPTPNPSPLNGEGTVGISNAADLITLIAGIGLGMVAGGGSVLVVVSRMRHDVVLLTAMERLAASWPAETKELLNNLASVLTEMTDNVPAVEKPRATVPVVDLPIHG